MIARFPFRIGRRRARGGFTILELMIVVGMIMILAAIAVGAYQKSLIRAREAALKQDLSTMRNAIQQYTLDKQAGPQSLDDLVSAGYLREVPTDPITRARNWHPDFENVLLSVDQTGGAGMTDVHSSAEGASPYEGTPYNSW